MCSLGLHLVGQLMEKVLDRGVAGIGLGFGNSLGSVEAGARQAGTTAGRVVRGTGQQRSRRPRKQGAGARWWKGGLLPRPGALPNGTAKRGQADAERTPEV